MERRPLQPASSLCGTAAEHAVAVVLDGPATGVASRPEHRGTPPLSFEIGSITKTMTATALAAQVVAGRARLDDPLGRWLAAGPNSDITLRQLATHTSGLPRISDKIRSGDPADPYAAYDETAALAELPTLVRTAPIGSYSNLGYILLGLVIERIVGIPLANVLDEVLLQPAGMRTARIADPAAPVAQGRRRGKAVNPWRQPLPGAGGVWARPDDLVAYIRTVQTPPTGPLGDALALVEAERLAWVHEHPDVRWHNGGTGGFRSMLARRRDTAAFVLLASNDDVPGLERNVITAITA